MYGIPGYVEGKEVSHKIVGIDRKDFCKIVFASVGILLMTLSVLEGAKAVFIDTMHEAFPQ